MKPVELRHGEIVLSVPTPADAPAITAACQDPAIAEYTTVPYPYRETDAHTFITTFVPRGWERGSPTWAIRVDGSLVGMIDLHGTEGGIAEIGYWMDHAHRGRGFLTVAVGPVLDNGFASGLRRIEWRAVVGNWGSWRPVWRHGFHREGTLRGSFADRRDPAAPWRDMWMGALLTTDPRTPAAPWDGPSR